MHLTGARTGLGRDDELDSLYSEGLPSWSTATVSDLTSLKRELATVRREGFGTNLEETERGVCALAVAVHDPDGDAVAALVVAVPSVRFQRRDVPRYLEVLDAASQVAERSLGAA